MLTCLFLRDLTLLLVNPAFFSRCSQVTGSILHSRICPGVDIMLIYTQFQKFLLWSSIKIGPRDTSLVSNFSVTLLAMHMVFWNILYTCVFKQCFICSLLVLSSSQNWNSLSHKPEPRWSGAAWASDFLWASEPHQPVTLQGRCESQTETGAISLPIGPCAPSRLSYLLSLSERVLKAFSYS